MGKMKPLPLGIHCLGLRNSDISGPLKNQVTHWKIIAVSLYYARGYINQFQ